MAAVAKIRACAEARLDKDFVINARTDAGGEREIRSATLRAKSRASGFAPSRNITSITDHAAGLSLPRKIASAAASRTTPSASANNASNSGSASVRSAATAAQ